MRMKSFKKILCVSLATVLMIGNVSHVFAAPVTTVPEEPVIAEEENTEIMESLPDTDAQVITFDENGEVIDVQDSIEEIAEEETEVEEAEETEAAAEEEEEAVTAGEDDETEEAEEEAPYVEYRTHVQTFGTLKWVRDGALSGTEGLAKRMESLEATIGGTKYEGSIEYRTHVQTYGWLKWVKDGELSGTTGQAKRMEALQVRLTGELAEHYDVYYAVHVQSIGWLGWAKNGEECGSGGLAKRLEAIKIKIVKKGDPAPGKTDRSFATLPSIGYSAYMESYGWVPAVVDGADGGVIGEGKRMEGIVVNTAKGTTLRGNVKYRTYCQTYGWKPWSQNWGINGAPGEGKRMEAIQIQLEGELAACCNVYYRVHVQNFGWLGWAVNGQSAGTTGLALRVEAVQILLAPKDGYQPVAAGNCLKAYTGPGEYIIGARRFFYTSDGNFVTGTGWFRFNNERYYAINGEIAKGWKYIGGLKYYFRPDGTLCQNVDSIIGVQSSYQIRVNKQMNCVTIYAKDGANGYIIPVKAMLCSTGDDTPIGTFYTPQKYRWKAMFNGTYAQYATRLTAGEGFLFHSITYEKTDNHTLIAFGYNGLGIVRSAGCIRLLCSEAYWIYTRCPLGTEVIVYNDGSSYGPFDRPTFTPIPMDQNYDPTDPFL